MKSVWKALLLSALLTLTTPVAAQTAPAFYRHQLGEMTVTALHDGVLHLPQSDMTGGDSQAIANALANSMAVVEEKGIRASVNAFLLEKHGQRVLVDVGTQKCFDSFAPDLGHVPSALQTAGVRPESIGHVLLTHAHPDHACGLLDGNGRMAYRNATVWIADTEYSYWMSDAEKAAIPEAFHFLFDQARAALAPYAAAGRLKRFAANTRLPLSIRALPAPGHTRGHTAFLLDDLLLWGDVMHFPAVQFSMPHVHYSADQDGAAAQASREALLQQAASNGWQVAGAHLPFPGIGKVVKGSGHNDVWRWVPVEYAPQPQSISSTRKDNTMNKRILFVLTSHDRKGAANDPNAAPSGFYLSEVSHPYFVLTEAGFNVDFVSPKGGKTHVDGLDLQDSDNARFWNDPQLQGRTQNTLAPQQVNAEDYAAIFYAGGHATMWDFADNTELAAIAAKIYDRGGVVAAVCHGPAGLVNIRLGNGEYLIAGKQLAAFTNDEEKAVGLLDVVPFLLEDIIKERGGEHLGAPNFQKQVVVSERLVTGQNPASACGVAEAMLELLSD